MSANIGNLEKPPHAKYERLIVRAKKVPTPKTIVVHPCDESSLRGALKPPKRISSSRCWLGQLRRSRP